MFHLALLCLLFSSCNSDHLVPEIDQKVYTRTSANIKATLELQNGSFYESNVLKAKCSPISNSLFAVKLFISATDSSTYICKNLQLQESNSLLSVGTIQPNLLYENKYECYATPFSASNVKISILPGNIVLTPNGFIGEEEDGF